MARQAGRTHCWWPLAAGAAVGLLGVLCAAWYVSALDWIPGGRDGGGDIVAGPGAAPRSHACGRCGVIESVREVNRMRNPPGVASVSDGKAGGVIAILHMVMNAMVGNPAGHTGLPGQPYEVVVRFHDGSTRTLTQVGTPSWSPGDPVKVINGRIKPDA